MQPPMQTLYSAGATTDENYNSSLGVITPTVTPICLNMLMTGTTCSASGNVPNAVKVTETATINTMLMRVLGFKTITVNATAIASMQGKAQPWNVAIIVDTTGSMSNTDTNCGSVIEASVRIGRRTDDAGVHKSVLPCEYK